MIPKNGYRFSEKMMLQQQPWSGMAIQGKVITPGSAWQGAIHWQATSFHGLFKGVRR